MNYRQLPTYVSAWYRSPRVLVFLACAVMAVGALLRLVQYAGNRSFWVDEVFLALNLRERTFAQLLTPLSYEQQAPIGYLLVEKLALLTLGESEYSLRLVALIASLLSLPLFFLLTRHFLSLRGRVLAILFFSFSDTLVYYASELKPYAVDLLVSICLYLVLLTYGRRPVLTTPLLLTLGLVGAIAVWFSLPSGFVLFGAGGGLFLFRVHKREWSQVKKFTAVFLLWVISFVIHFQLSLGHYISDYSELWQRAYLPVALRSMGDVGRLLRLITEAFSVPVGVSFSLLGFGFFFIGCLVFLQQRKRDAFLLLAPIAATAIASIFHRYPFADRFLIFLSPIAFVLMTVGIAWTVTVARASGRLTLVAGMFVLIAFLFIRPLTSAGYFFVVTHQREEVKPLLRYMRTHRKDGDFLYLYYGASFAFSWYAPQYGLSGIPRISGGEYRNDLSLYKAELARLGGNERVWVLFSHNYTGGAVDEEKFFVRNLDLMGKRVEERYAIGASLYLYNLGESHTL